MTHTLRTILILLLAALLGSIAAAPLHAQDAPSRPWNSLDPDQREVLAPLEKKRDGMPADKQGRMQKRDESREEERRVGKECVSTLEARREADHQTKKKKK